MKPEISKIFNSTSCLTENEIRDYISGKLSSEKFREVELHLADCLMCSDEIEGLSILSDDNKLNTIVAGLNSQIDNKISNTKLKQDLNIRKNKNIVRSFISIAASFILIIAAGFLIKLYMIQTDNKTAYSPEKEITTEEKVIIPDKNNTAPATDNKENTVTDITKQKKQEKNKTENFTPEEKTATNTSNDKKNEIDYVVETIPAETSNVINSEKTEDEYLAEENTTEISNNNNDNAVTDNVTAGNNNFFGTATRGNNFKSKTSDKKNKEKYRSLRESALLSYDLKIYDEALTDFLKYLEYKPNDTEILYKSGISYYNLKKYNKAILQLNKVIDGFSGKYTQDSEWYKANSLIKLGKKEEAKTILNKIITENGKYQNKALDLLNSFEN